MDKVNVLLQGGFALQLGLAVTLWALDCLVAMDSSDVLLQANLALHLGLAVTLRALEQLHLWPHLLGGDIPSGI